jgi:hypothetical protein
MPHFCLRSQLESFMGSGPGHTKGCVFWPSCIRGHLRLTPGQCCRLRLEGLPGWTFQPELGPLARQRWGGSMD